MVEQKNENQINHSDNHPRRHCRKALRPSPRHPSVANAACAASLPPPHGTGNGGLCLPGTVASNHTGASLPVTALCTFAAPVSE